LVRSCFFWLTWFDFVFVLEASQKTTTSYKKSTTKTTKATTHTTINWWGVSLAFGSLLIQLHSFVF
jgi:hypothetical protein